MNDHQFILEDAEQTCACLLSAVDRLERLAMMGSQYVRPCRAELIECSDRLATLVVKLLDVREVA